MALTPKERGEWKGDGQKQAREGRLSKRAYDWGFGSADKINEARRIQEEAYDEEKARIKSSK